MKLHSNLLNAPLEKGCPRQNQTVAVQEDVMILWFFLGPIQKPPLSPMTQAVKGFSLSLWEWFIDISVLEYYK